jgi:alanyl-tRNA synthetase
MRRAMRHGNGLGLTEPFLCTLVDVLVAQMGDAYPELRSGHDYVSRVVASEEERFEAVLTAGLPRLEEVLDQSAAPSRGSMALNGLPPTVVIMRGDDVFKLYDSYGLPVEFIEDTAPNRA